MSVELDFLTCILPLPPKMPLQMPLLGDQHILRKSVRGTEGVKWKKEISGNVAILPFPPDDPSQYYTHLYS